MSAASADEGHTIVEQEEALRRVERWVARQREQRMLLSDGLLVGVEERSGGRFLYTYDKAGDLTRIVEADGSAISYAYDERRRLIRLDHSDGSTSRYRYGEHDRLLEIVGPSGNPEGAAPLPWSIRRSRFGRRT